MDATDNYAARYLLCDACALANKVLISGAVFRYEGRVAAFDSSSGPVYRDLHPEPPTADLNCEQAGVLGVVTGAMGSLMANECIKILADIGESLIGKLLIYDFWNHDTLITPLPDKNQRQVIKNLIDYEQFCSIRKNKKTGMKEVTVQELKQLIDSKADFQLIDVREPHEFDICNLGGELIPQGDLPGVIDRIDKTKKVVIHCRSGARSGNMVQWLEKHHGFTNLYNLKGGILAWADEIDTSMTKY
jgi:adenylyltransferase/sulfurtransferase